MIQLTFILVGAFILRSAIDGVEPSLPEALGGPIVRKRTTGLERIGFGIVGAYLLITGIVPAARHW